MSSARNNRRRRKNRGRFSFLFKVLAIIAILAALTMGATVFFQLEQVVVSGNSRYTAQEVEAASGLQPGDNLFRMNKNRVAGDIREKLPYVEGVNIVRNFPSTIVITVQEWDAVAKVEPTELKDEDLSPEVEEEEAKPELADRSWLISVKGKLLETANEDSTAIRVTGLSALSPKAGTQLAVPQSQQEKLTALLELLAVLEARGSTKLVSEIDLSSVTQIRLRYDQRFWVKLPMVCDFSYKISALETVVAQREPYEKGTMDLTREDYTVIFSPE